MGRRLRAQHGITVRIMSSTRVPSPWPPVASTAALAEGLDHSQRLDGLLARRPEEWNACPVDQLSAQASRSTSRRMARIASAPHAGFKDIREAVLQLP